MPLAPRSRARLQATIAGAGGILLWWRAPNGATTAIAVVTGTLAALAWLLPGYYAPVQRGFDRLTHALVSALTWLVLGIVYFCLFMPMRIWRAMLRHDPLRLRRDSTASSFLQSIAPPSPRHFNRQF